MKHPDVAELEHLYEIIEKIHKLCHVAEFGEENMQHEYQSSNTKANQK